MFRVKSNKNNQKRLMRNGQTIIETGFVILLSVIVVGTAIAGFNKMYTSIKGDSAFQSVNSVLSSIERSKNSNRSVYPVGASTNISAIPVIINELGGINNAQDVAAWTYSCTAGSGRTITLVTSAFDDATVASIASQKVTSNLAPWVSTLSGTVLTITLSNVTCN